jgi:DNA-binding NtrC family response regulator
LGTQARLLRVLETGEFIRVGSSKVQKTNVRVIAATNRELLDHASVGKFREDLYYRLSTVPIRVPALRERKEDIPLLFRKFAGDFAEKYRTQTVQLDAPAQQLLVNYPWPGNVRELKNIAEQVSVLSTNKTITADVLAGFLPQRLPVSASSAPMLPTLSHAPNTMGADASSTERDILYKLFFDLKKDMNDIKGVLFDMAHGNFNGAAKPRSNETLLPAVGYSDSSAAGGFGNVSPVVMQPMQPVVSAHEDVEESLSLTEREKEIIAKALKKHRGRRRDAAVELGISERTLYRKIKEYDIEE